VGHLEGEVGVAVGVGEGGQSLSVSEGDDLILLAVDDERGAGDPLDAELVVKALAHESPAAADQVPGDLPQGQVGRHEDQQLGVELGRNQGGGAAAQGPAHHDQPVHVQPQGQFAGEGPGVLDGQVEAGLEVVHAAVAGVLGQHHVNGEVLHKLEAEVGGQPHILGIAVEVDQGMGGGALVVGQRRVEEVFARGHREQSE
jgi:hypothetical protein